MESKNKYKPKDLTPHWKEKNNDYQLVLQIKDKNLLVFLDTTQKCFQKELSFEEIKELPMGFQTVQEIFQQMKDRRICGIDFQCGVLQFRVKLCIGNRQKERIDKIQLEELRNMDCFQLQYLYRKLAKRQSNTEEQIKQLRQENQKIKQTIDLIGYENLEKINKFKSKNEDKIKQLKIDVQAICQENFTNFQEQNLRNQRQIKEQIQLIKKKLGKNLKSENDLFLQETFKKIRGRDTQAKLEKRKNEYEIEKQLLTEIDVLKKKVVSSEKKESVFKKSSKINLKNKYVSEIESDKSIQEIPPEQQVDLSTPYAHYFKIQSRTIVRKQGQNSTKQILLKTVIQKKENNKIYARILKTKDRKIKVGIVDRKRQKQQVSSYESCHAICYSGKGGRIYYGQKGCKKHSDTKMPLTQGMQIRLNVDIAHGMVTFIFKDNQNSTNHRIETTMLRQPNIQLVPYFQMSDGGDCIEWFVQ